MTIADVCCDRLAPACSDCGGLLNPVLHIRLIPAWGEDVDPLDDIQDRLDAASTLRGAGWQIRATSTGLDCQPPEQDEDIIDRLRRLGIGEDMMRAWGEPILLRDPEEILEAAMEFACREDYVLAAEELRDEGPDGPGLDRRSVLMAIRREAEELIDLEGFEGEVADEFRRGVLAGSRSALEWVLCEGDLP